MERPLMTATEVAKAFRTSNKTIRAWAKAGYIPAIVTPTGRYLFRACDVAKLLAVGAINRAH